MAFRYFSASLSVVPPAPHPTPPYPTPFVPTLLAQSCAPGERWPPATLFHASSTQPVAMLRGTTKEPLASHQEKSLFLPKLSGASGTSAPSAKVRLTRAGLGLSVLYDPVLEEPCRQNVYFVYDVFRRFCVRQTYECCGILYDTDGGMLDGCLLSAPAQSVGFYFDPCCPLPPTGASAWPSGWSFTLTTTMTIPLPRNVLLL